jgi:glycosyltransferase involved in cell wall biosynthesis
MRALFVTNLWPDPERPHYGTFIRSQACSLEAAGVAVDVLNIRGSVSRRAYALAPKAVVAARARPYDVVHVHTGHAALISMPFAPRPVVLSFVGMDILGQPRAHGVTPKSRAERTVFRQLARAATRTITKSVEMERALPPRARRRNHVIPNGVDLDVFAPQPRTEARARLGWSIDDPVALFLGDPADPRKNVELATAATSIARRSLPALRLELAWGARPEDVPTLMSAADCLVVPSRSEGSPNVVKEAMAAALPVVATPVGDVPERLAGIAGCYVVPPDPNAVAEAILAASTFGRVPEAREAVMPLSLERVAARILEVYELALGGSRGR